MCVTATFGPNVWAPSSLQVDGVTIKPFAYQ